MYQNMNNLAKIVREQMCLIVLLLWHQWLGVSDADRSIIPDLQSMYEKQCFSADMQVLLVL